MLKFDLSNSNLPLIFPSLSLSPSPMPASAPITPRAPFGSFKIRFARRPSKTPTAALKISPLRSCRNLSALARLGYLFQRPPRCRARRWARICALTNQARNLSRSAFATRQARLQSTCSCCARHS